MSRTLGKILSIASCIILVWGCASPQETFLYDLRLTPPEGVVDAGNGPMLQLLDVEVPDYLNRQEIFYRTSEYGAGYYTYHRWVRPLARSLEAELLGYLRATGRFKTVYGPGEEVADEVAALRVEVEAFDEVDSVDGNDWVAKVSLRVRIEMPGGGDGRIVPVEAVVRAEERNAEGTVRALNLACTRAAGRIVDELLLFLSPDGR